MSRRTVVFVLIIAGLVFALFALLAALVGGFSAPLWVLPLAVVLVAVGVLISLIP